MQKKGWLAEFGFYESADYAGTSGYFREPKYTSWFTDKCSGFADARLAQAGDLILQKRPLRVKPIADFQPKRIGLRSQERRRTSD